MQWLNDYRMRLMAIGFVAVIALGGGSAKADFTFGEPTNLGATVNSSAREQQPSISDDGLSLCFKSLRPGGYGDWDLWMTTRPMTTAAWAEPVNLGPAVNTSYRDSDPSISADSLCLFFHSDRPGGFGDRRRR